MENYSLVGRHDQKRYSSSSSRPGCRYSSTAWRIRCLCSSPTVRLTQRARKSRQTNLPVERHRRPDRSIPSLETNLGRRLPRRSSLRSRPIHPVLLNCLGQRILPYLSMPQPSHRRRRHPFKVPLPRSPSIANVVCLLCHATHPFNCRFPSARTSHWSTRPIRTRLCYLP